jgi:hypothetical protein
MLKVVVGYFFSRYAGLSSPAPPSGGEAFIRTLAKRLMRFVWGDVEQDILKILYENFIGTETRKKLGEYYTPDWLAEIIVSETVKDPLKTRVLDLPVAPAHSCFMLSGCRALLNSDLSHFRGSDSFLLKMCLEFGYECPSPCPEKNCCRPPRC